ncbi:MAG: DNA primase [Firmicutes bacterium ADurb.Bin456]|nr:MAG: DNA primase [Firmicutes bacterium ADurb.Bin456]
MTPSAPDNPTNPIQDAIMEHACMFFQSCLTANHGAFLLKRYGLTSETVDRFRVGYCPTGWSDLLDYLLGKGHGPKDIQATGLFYVTDRGTWPVWRGRLMFPYLEGGRVRYFIGRQTEDTQDRNKDGTVPKYRKQLAKSDKRPHIQAWEPIFGSDSITPGQPVVLTEGITDCIITIQAGFPCISPVTVRVKAEHARRVAELVRPCSKVVLIMDSEDNQAGTWGAVDTGLELCRHGIFPFIGTIPRPSGVDKVDLNDFIRDGGDVADLITQAVLIDFHPLTKERKRETWAKAAERMITGMVRDHYRDNPPKNQTRQWTQDGPTLEEKKDIVKRYLSLSQFTGFSEGYGPHPIYGSKTGTNLSVTGETWYSFHAGHEGGGDALQWVAIYELSLIREGEPLRGADFGKTIQYCWEKYVPDHAKKVLKTGPNQEKEGL